MLDAIRAPPLRMNRVAVRSGRCEPRDGGEMKQNASKRTSINSQ